MAQGRFLKKKTSLSKPLAKLKNDTHRMLFTWAIPHLDIEGRMTGDTEVFKAVVCPLLKHITLQKIELFFNDSQQQRIIQRYNIDGNYYLQFLGFRDEQPQLRSDREGESKIPSPPPGELPENSNNTQEDSGLIEVKLKEVNIYAHAFEKFWKEWPNKVAKEDAIKAFNKIKDLDIEMIIKAIKAQKANRAKLITAKEFVPDWPYPATWLNGKRWKDEIKEPPSQDLRSYHKEAIVEPKEKLTQKERETAKKRLQDMSNAIGNKRDSP